jgi:predicted SnoaL-like aldol condensation-catalyzing enzyme
MNTIKTTPPNLIIALFGKFKKLRQQALMALSCALAMSFAQTAFAQSPSPKEIVTAFYEMAFVKGQTREAILKYISPTTYIQHNPMVPDGREAALAVLPDLVSKSGMRAEIKRVIAEGDLVVIHSRAAVPNNSEKPALAIIDIFRVKDGLIVEHWDVIQEVPKESANKNTMF